MPETSDRNPERAAPGCAEELARLVASLIHERKGEDVVILRMEEVLPLTDFFVLATGGNDRHVGAIREHVEKELKDLKVRRLNRAGLTSKTWVLLDYGDVVVHIFQPEAREHYDLELLWADAPRLE